MATRIIETNAVTRRIAFSTLDGCDGDFMERVEVLDDPSKPWRLVDVMHCDTVSDLFGDDVHQAAKKQHGGRAVFSMVMVPEGE